MSHHPLSVSSGPSCGVGFKGGVVGGETRSNRGGSLAWVVLALDPVVIWTTAMVLDII